MIGLEVTRSPHAYIYIYTIYHLRKKLHFYISQFKTKIDAYKINYGTKLYSIVP